MLGAERSTVALKRQQILRPQEVIEQQIRRVAALAMHHHRAGLRSRLNHLHQRRHRHPLPIVIHEAEASHAVKIGMDRRCCDRPKLLEIEIQFPLHQPGHRDPPIGRVFGRGRAVSQHRPVLYDVLPRRQSVRELLREIQLPLTS